MKSLLASLILFVAALPASAHMGQYPCRTNAELVQQVRQLSGQASEKGEYALARVLSLAADAEYHCWGQGMGETMKAYMEGVGSPEEEQNCVLDSDGPPICFDSAPEIVRECKPMLGGDYLCYDSRSGMVWKATPEELEKLGVPWGEPEGQKGEPCK